VLRAFWSIISKSPRFRPNSVKIFRVPPLRIFYPCWYSPTSVPNRKQPTSQSELLFLSILLVRKVVIGCLTAFFLVLKLEGTSEKNHPVAMAKSTMNHRSCSILGDVRKMCHNGFFLWIYEILAVKARGCWEQSQGWITKQSCGSQLCFYWFQLNYSLNFVNFHHFEA